MNLTTIDEFLYEKSIRTIEQYFAYLEQGFVLIDKEAKEVPKEKEHLLVEYFGKDVIAYQVIATTFISEVFHIVESYLKSNLLRVGEYLIYPSLDKYPEHKERLDQFNERQNKEIVNLLVAQAKATVKMKDDRIKEISKKLAKQFFLEEKGILVNSISCSEALYRLEKYLHWTITDEVKERFALFIENRNEIIHFNKLTNLTFACSHSLFVLVNLCGSNPTLYPKFYAINDYLSSRIGLYNILIPEILNATELYKVFDKIETSTNKVNKVFSSIESIQ